MAPLIDSVSNACCDVAPNRRSFSAKRLGMVSYSPYPFDPRVRRAVDALVKEGASVDLICLGTDKQPARETQDNVDVFRIPLKNARRGRIDYAFRYATFIFIASLIFASRAILRRYDLVYVHNMPDILVASALIPKMFGAKVVLDLHDPMPELLTTIFDASPDAKSVRWLKRLEKWSIAQADLVITVNIACQRIFSSRSCRPEKIGVVMNAPDSQIFPFRSMTMPNLARRPENKPFVLMYHGSLVERNGLEVAIDALERVRKTVPTAELHIFGSKTDFLIQMMEKVREKQLQDAVRYFGPKRQEDLVIAIEGCDLGVIPNHQNAFTEINTPTRIFEYLALGKPVIAPSTRGIRDYFDKESLLFFEAGNSGDLAQRIEYAFSRPSEVFEITRRGQEVYLTHTWESERQTLLTRVREILNRG